MKYAKNTLVSVEKSKAEIESILTRYGADQFISGWDQEKAYIGFRMKNRMIKFVLPLPDRNSKEFKTTPKRRHTRTPEQIYEAWEQACRQRWRALALAIKAKLELTEIGIRTFEEEFLNDIILPDGKTAGEFLIPQIQIAYETANMPKLIPFIKES